MNENSAAAPANMAYVSRQTVMFAQTAKAIMPLILWNLTMYAMNGRTINEDCITET